jgi:hypothetical protein
MTYVVTSGHVVSLKSGRMVAPRDEVSNAEARENPRLIERGVLTERDKRKAKPASKQPASEPESKSAAPSSEPEKEVQK